MHSLVSGRDESFQGVFRTFPVPWDSLHYYQGSGVLLTYHGELYLNAILY
jgi:hypothetical protein